MSLDTVEKAPDPPTLAPSTNSYSSLHPLFLQYRILSPDDGAKSALREQIITAYLPVARNIGRRFARRGEPIEDLIQVATVGLINAFDRFDSTRGVDFLSFAIPTIMGEVRRYFRDLGWDIRVPRRYQELRQVLLAATAELAQRDGSTPSINDLAVYLHLSPVEVGEGLIASNVYTSLSLDAPVGEEPGSSSLSDTLGGEDRAFESVDNHDALSRLLAEEPARERRILALRFWHDQTQTQIAAEIGVSQMHISRLITAALERLRTGMDADVAKVPVSSSTRWQSG